MTDSTGSEALQIGIQTETDGMAFYSQAASKCSNPLGKRMFESLVRDERNHLAWLHDVAKGVIPKDDCVPGEVFKGEAKTIFKEVTDDLKKRIEAGPDDIEAVKIAMEMEEKAYRFYVKAATEATGEAEKKLFQKLAVEENAHWLMLEDTHLYMTAPEIWDIKNNPPQLEG